MRAARDALITRYANLVPMTRRRLLPNVPRGIEADDLEGAGRIALVLAADRFDEKRRVDFRSFAITGIRGAMLEFLRNDDWVPRSIRHRQRAGEPVAILELLSLEDLPPVAASFDGDEPLSPLARLPDPAPGPAAIWEAAWQAAVIWQAVERLEPFERLVIVGYYWGDMELKALGRRLGRSESRIGQIHRKALLHLGRQVG
jgi:RNA polymerase sigma factor for flagellar operon FliA